MSFCGKKKGGELLHCWRGCKLIQPLCRTVWRFPKKLGIKLPYDPAIPLLDIHPENTIIQNDTGTLVSTAALFTVSRTWKQPKSPSADEWIKEMWCVYIYIYMCMYNGISLGHEIEWIKSIVVMWIDLESVTESEISQKEINKYCILMHIYIYGMWKNGTDEPICKTGILWPPDVKSQLIGKDPDAGKDWEQEEKGPTEDEMVGWTINGHEFEHAPGDGEGQGGLACCGPRGHNEWDTTEWLNMAEVPI